MSAFKVRSSSVRPCSVQSLMCPLLSDKEMYHGWTFKFTVLECRKPLHEKKELCLFLPYKMCKNK